MNDKNFIEELRQKREEYGVTQTRLAVACGISREYYNRIEKGKQPLNDELKEVLEKQIERFNPQEPLFLLIDYFRFRFPTTDALAIIRDVLQLKSDYMLYEDYGKYGYESKYVLGDINIMCSMQEHLGVLLELKGKGCRQHEGSGTGTPSVWAIAQRHHGITEFRYEYGIFYVRIYVPLSLISILSHSIINLY